MEWLVLGLFCLDLLVCILLGLSTLTALVIGLFLFIGYGLYKGHRLPALFAMMWDGVRTVKSILVVFLIIGILTATWRAAGTIPAIIYYTLPLIRPSVFVPLVFLLNSLVSFLIGISFGTAATMGVICMTMGLTMGADPVLLGGAILSGVFYGDRCSPVSTSAMLVAQLTGTDLYDNLRRMFGTAALPTALSVILYYFLGRSGAGAVDDNVRTLFAEHFHLSVLTLLPAAAILVLALCRVKVRQAMLISIALAVCYQHGEEVIDVVGIGQTLRQRNLRMLDMLVIVVSDFLLMGVVFV